MQRVSASFARRVDKSAHGKPVVPLRHWLGQLGAYSITATRVVLTASTLCLAQPVLADVSKVYKFDNFDDRTAELHLTITDADYRRSLIDTWKFARSGRTADQNYIAMVKGLFSKGKPSVRFVYDAFVRALPHVSDEYFLNTLVAFVQSRDAMPYRIPPSVHRGVRTGGLFTPVVSLYEGYGDCDTRSLLFACIASHRYKVIFLVGPRHAFVGVAAEPAKGQEFVELKGRRYVLFETTAEWGLGKLPASSRSDIDAGRYYYIDLE